MSTLIYNTMLCRPWACSGCR